MTHLSIIIVNFNVRVHLERCLRSLGRYPDIVVVDNHSEDDSLLMLRQHFPWVKCLALPTNVGFGKAVNLAAQMATGNAYLILNPDTELVQNTLEDVVAQLEMHPEASVLGFRQITQDNHFQLSFGPYPSFLAEMARRSIQRRLDAKALALGARLDTLFSTTTPVAWVAGSSLCLRKEAFWRVGGFDEGYFLFFEDIDFCLRLGQQVGPVMYDPAITIRHERGAASRQATELARQAYRHSQKRFWRRYHGRGAALCLRAYLRWQGD